MPRHVVPSEQRRFAKRLRAHQTDAETLLWHELRGRRLDGWKFRRQVPIERFVVDFVCFEARLIVEVDGPLHLDAEQRRKDEARDALLRMNGFKILRFSTDVAVALILRDIQQALLEAEGGLGCFFAGRRSRALSCFA
jgi:very-short-patch-repair endonuclease